MNRQIMNLYECMNDIIFEMFHNFQMYEIEMVLKNNAAVRDLKDKVCLGFTVIILGAFRYHFSFRARVN